MSKRAASRALSPSITIEIARALRLFEYPLAIVPPRRCRRSNSNLICRPEGTPCHRCDSRQDENALIAHPGFIRQPSARFSHLANSESQFSRWATDNLNRLVIAIRSRLFLSLCAVPTRSQPSWTAPTRRSGTCFCNYPSGGSLNRQLPLGRGTRLPTDGVLVPIFLSTGYYTCDEKKRASWAKFMSMMVADATRATIKSHITYFTHAQVVKRQTLSKPCLKNAGRRSAETLAAA